MKKKDLKTGMYVKLRDDSICIVQKEQELLVDVKSGGYVELRYYNDDLTIMQNLLCFDVVVVYENFKKVNVLWERKELLTKEEKEYLKAVIKPFKDEVESVESKMDNLRINLKYKDFMIFPFYETLGFKFLELEYDRKYTLKELGLED